MNEVTQELRRSRCAPCEGTPPLTAAQIQPLLAGLQGWTLEGDAIVKAYRFKNYHETMAFVNAAAWISHREDHHPGRDDDQKVADQERQEGKQREQRELDDRDHAQARAGHGVAVPGAVGHGVPGARGQAPRAACGEGLRSRTPRQGQSSGAPPSAAHAPGIRTLRSGRQVSHSLGSTMSYLLTTS